MKQIIKKQPAPIQSSGISLPGKPNIPDADMRHYAWCIYGAPKVGKTTLLSTFPKAIFFNTEPGSKGLSVYEFNGENGGVSDWKILRKGIDLLEENPKAFETIVIDTGDRAYDMCLDYVCETQGIEYPGKSSDGKEDFGKSWRAVKMEFLEIIHRIQRIGMGLAITSHVSEQELKTRSGTSYHKITPSMSKQARDTIIGIVDFILYAENVQTIQGKNQRVLICQGDDHVMAGGRQLPCGKEFPQFLPLLKENGFDVLKRTFAGEDMAIDPNSIMVSINTKKAAAELVRSSKNV